MTRLTLVRHGETYQNFTHRVQGQDPTQGRLTAHGVRQAELLGQALAARHFDIGYCSTLERAVLTMGMLLLKRPGERTLPLVFAEELREIHLGILHGRSHDEWRAAIRGDPMEFRQRRTAGTRNAWRRVQRGVGHQRGRVRCRVCPDIEYRPARILVETSIPANSGV